MQEFSSNPLQLQRSHFYQESSKSLPGLDYESSKKKTRRHTGGVGQLKMLSNKTSKSAEKLFFLWARKLGRRSEYGKWEWMYIWLEKRNWKK
jgi:hypothetical protein